MSFFCQGIEERALKYVKTVEDGPFFSSKLKEVYRRYQRVLPHSLCKVGMHCSTHNTNFRLTFLLTRLQEALYEDLPV